MSKAKDFISIKENLKSKSKSVSKLWKKPVSAWPKRLFPDMPISRHILVPLKRNY